MGIIKNLHNGYTELKKSHEKAEEILTIEEILTNGDGFEARYLEEARALFYKHIKELRDNEVNGFLIIQDAIDRTVKYKSILKASQIRSTTQVNTIK
jgi:hypothetical protein